MDTAVVKRGRGGEGSLQREWECRDREGTGRDKGEATSLEHRRARGWQKEPQMLNQDAAIGTRGSSESTGRREGVEGVGKKGRKGQGGWGEREREGRGAGGGGSDGGGGGGGGVESFVVEAQLERRGGVPRQPRGREGREVREEGTKGRRGER